MKVLRPYKNLPVIFILLSLIIISGYYYIKLRQNFYDDVFIYLNISRNAVESGTWQYFPLVSRPALLATSPLKIVILTLSSYISNLLGFSERDLVSAKVTLLINGYITYLIWWPFWRKKNEYFLLLGVIFFILSLSLNTIIEFEGGLLFLWIVTLLFTLRNKNYKDASLLVGLGVFIRPDITIPINLIVVLFLLFEKEYKFVVLALKFFIIITFTWVTIATIYKVWPIPITYWAKSSLSTLFEDRHMIYYFFERIGRIFLKKIENYPELFSFVGISIIFTFLITVIKSNISKFFAIISLVSYGYIFSKAPANYWWYYENFLIAIIGVMTGLVISETITVSRFSIQIHEIKGIYLFAILSIMTVGSAFEDGPSIWSFAYPSRAQGYVYLAKNVYNGAYWINGIGYSFIRNPEIGITGYFSGKEGWVYDMGGLAQPLDLESVQNNILRFFYPEVLRHDASYDLQILHDLHNNQYPIVTVWAMEDRDFDNAKAKCRLVDVRGALCINW